MIEIRIRRDEDVNRILEGTPVTNAEVPVAIIIDGNFVAEHATEEGFVPIFIGLFWATLLEGLPDLKAGGAVRTEVEFGWYGFESTGRSVDVYFDYDEPESRRGPRYQAGMQEFAAEVISTAAEFFEFCRAVRPSFAGSESDEHYRSKVETARGWYRETYGTDPGT